MKHSKTRGFSLIELLIVIVVISLLGTMAMSSYSEHVRKSRRAKAKADLMELAQLIERNYTESNRFDQDATGAFFPVPISRSPQQGTTFYNLSYTALPTPNTYVIQAVPVGGQVNDTRCMTLTLDMAGNRTESGTGTPAECW